MKSFRFPEEVLERFQVPLDFSEVSFFCLVLSLPKRAVLASDTRQRIVRTTCARKKKPEFFGIACRGVLLQFERLSKILDERKGVARFFALLILHLFHPQRLYLFGKMKNIDGNEKRNSAEPVSSYEKR